MNAFPYPGNKARYAEWIVEHFPEHTCYVEPFGGAASVLFNKPRSKVEVYNDADGDLVHFFGVLRDRPNELREWLEKVPFSRQLHEEWARDFYDDNHPDDDVERAGRFFALRYMQFGGKYDGDAGFAAGTQESYSGAFANGTDSLDKFADRLREVSIECEDWNSILERYDHPDTVFYLDPPYQGTEYQYGSDRFEHRELYQRIVDIEGYCLISYDSVPHWYGEGFQVDAHKGSYKIANTAGEGRKEATEYLIMNFDSGGEPLMSGVGQQGLDSFGGEPSAE